MKEETTHFGYEDVAVGEKASRVRGVFDSVASKYDVMNDLMSMGVHRLWKKQAIELSGAREGWEVLDLAGGTGDLSLQFARIVGPKGRVVLSDINQSMLHNGRERLVNEGVLGNVEYVQINAEQIPFPDNSFDCITISFGLRNVTDKDKALRAIYKALKPGGRLLVLEFSKPTNEKFRSVYDFYSFNILPVIGKVVANDEESYRYLAESIRMHPDQETLRGMMDEAGFNRTEYFNMTGGVVALHRGFKQ
ncbi:MAG: bifunctional demethylmenaquinone methyltransferase/2-methoxy-6-polyprenyl-1,4-benzoquinol methylase UbiE [Gammaproteobacteria bacterium]|jgi:demethylmenaquinone methyltransferase/2-methoxy-6-polyprenyl-1,4-benzoquinol methylase|nr:bifunctional demethylmenaquinone methyltransferase/2-methoxy-6-polyprenyl-1,4-benzoquinol methylase UbiE [Gammaproteobacteria bacterium]MBT4810654.1 bifunctional demethylmenaquinone methyltransferase/2-methoxy-6-polyprenyl-1,4-benzoquinol methylase UbiE [Thiotrichales bacterium]MBT3966358.1 bifunctional demethylmenaquinone methyltransferase/2-methoxy-6-polyprenyl-1,4-benzoquinol methylase UbiE [Gammaproteobacteria bacterium]MBT4330585.1 bifunctional demethylmenaquinone methyltransferase/2-met